MFKRLYEYGGVWYVIGGIGVLAMFPAVGLLAIKVAGVAVSTKVLTMGFIAFLVGGLIVSVVFNSENMQVVAQNRTTDVLEKISQQLDEQAEKKSRTHLRHPHRHARH